MRGRSRFSWLECIIGVLLVLAGIFTFITPGKALSGMVFIYGIIAVIMGIADIFLYIQMDRYIGFGPVVSLISGILSVMAGIMLLVYPGAGVMVLSLLFPIWFIAHCISRLTHLNQIRIISGDGMYYSTLIINVIGMILGFMMIFRPMFSLAAIGWIAGIYLVLLGIDSIIMAFSKMGV